MPGTPKRDSAGQMGRNADAPPSDARIPDARPGNWVDRFAPGSLKPYLELGRFDRPIGWWLLLWPCWWSVALAAREVPDGWRFAVSGGNGWPDPALLALFCIGAVAMRAAGCAYNDIVDRDVDGAVVRTALRPLPSGRISPARAAAFGTLMALIGLAVLATFNGLAIALGVASLGIVALYPHMKRVTHYPQLVLGLAFNWGALMGWAALTGELGPAPVALYLAGVAWTLGYDTIYAHQDREDDLLVGVKSMAIRLGPATKPWLAVFYAAAAAGLVAAGWLAGAGVPFYAGMSLAAVQFAWQVIDVDLASPEDCLKKFRSNHLLGALVFLAIAAGGVF